MLNNIHIFAIMRIIIIYNKETGNGFIHRFCSESSF